MAQQVRDRRKRAINGVSTAGIRNKHENGEHKPSESKTAADVDRPCTAFEGCVLVALYIALVAYSINEMLYVPQPLPLDASHGVFSEARALQHVRALSEDIGERQVSTAGVERAAVYLLQELQQLQDDPLLRDDVTLEVIREQVSGAVNFNFLGAHITNAYQNITNVVARLTPKYAKSKWAFLVNAHFDSTMGTAGASDCASCVGVSMEALRTAATNASIQLDGPVVFLFNGGEETLMQAAHGFLNSSVWQENVGSFVNLESTGPRGLPILFQHTGSWTASVYAQYATLPRGTAMSQDFFESGLIPGDTDFKMLSATYQGRLPGLDIAYVLGGSMYHTFEDKVDNIRPGTLQELGEGVLGLMTGFTGEMARMANGTSKESREASAYYFPIFWKMVAYPKSYGMLLHNAPLLMLLTMPGQINSVMRELKLGLSYTGILRGMLLCGGSVVSALLLPLLGAALRALLLGTPLVFFAHHALAYMAYAPLALIGLLLPITMSSCDLPSALFGSSWLWGIAGFFATKYKLGAAIYPFLWIAPIHVAYTITIQQTHFVKLLALLMATSIASYVSITSSYTMVEHVMDKVNLAGAFDGLLGKVFADSVVGAIVGLGMILAMGTLAPAAAVAVRPIRKPVMAALLLTSIAAAGYSTWTFQPYDAQHPKRIFCQHLHVVGEHNKVSSHWVVATTDPYPVTPLLSVDYRMHARPVEETMKRYLYPLSKILQGVALPAPGPPQGHLGGLVPSIRQTSRGPVEEGAAAGAPDSARIQILLDTIAPCWGILNITGPKVLNWSFTDSVSSVQMQGAPNGVMHLVRFAGNEGSEQWAFWLDVQGQERLRIELTAKYFEPNDEVQRFGEQFPAWVAYTGLLVYHLDWEGDSSGQLSNSR